MSLSYRKWLVRCNVLMVGWGWGEAIVEENVRGCWDGWWVGRFWGDFLVRKKAHFTFAAVWEGFAANKFIGWTTGRVIIGAMWWGTCRTDGSSLSRWKWLHNPHPFNTPCAFDIQWLVLFIRLLLRFDSYMWNLADIVARSSGREDAFNNHYYSGISIFAPNIDLIGPFDINSTHPRAPLDHPRVTSKLSVRFASL